MSRAIYTRSLLTRDRSLLTHTRSLLTHTRSSEGGRSRAILECGW